MAGCGMTEFSWWARGATGFLLLVGACADTTGPSSADGAELSIAVAPLSLTGVENACYGLSALNEAGETVWERSGICADNYGDGESSISFVGPCDATDTNDDGTAAATVVLTIDSLYGPDGPDDGTEPDLLTGWMNPCGPPYAPTGCRRQAVCRANADTGVTFDLTVMRQANQGFFDVAVNFEDIFCSAKVDCAYPATESAPARPIELVIDPATNERVQTVVFGFACTDGDPGTSEATATHLYMDDLVLNCGGTSYTVFPSDGPGNLYPAGVGAPAPLAQAIVFEGREPVADADMVYWNVALGLDPGFFGTGTPPNCTLETKATASKGPLLDGVTPVDTNYPYISVSVPLNTGTSITCTQHGLDAQAPNAGVHTAYTGPNATDTGFASASFDNVAAQAAGAVSTTAVCPGTGSMDFAPLAASSTLPAPFTTIAWGTPGQTMNNGVEQFQGPRMLKLQVLSAPYRPTLLRHDCVQQADTQVLAQVGWLSFGSLALRTQGTNFTDARGYQLQFNANHMSLNAVTGGSTNSLIASSLASVTCAECVDGSDLMVRFEARGTTVRARWWAVNAAEPTTWNISVVNNQIPDAGGFGVISYTNYPSRLRRIAWANVGDAAF